MLKAVQPKHRLLDGGLFGEVESGNDLDLAGALDGTDGLPDFAQRRFAAQAGDKLKPRKYAINRGDCVDRQATIIKPNLAARRANRRAGDMRRQADLGISVALWSLNDGAAGRRLQFGIRR